MSIIHHAELPRAALPGIDHVTLASGQDGLKSLSVWQQRIAPGQASPPHRHDCEEVVVVQSGRGELHIEGRIERFGANTTLVVPPNVPHQIFNVGDEPMELLAVLSVTPVRVELPDGQPLPLPWVS
ncbi:MAG: cupin domain-containing protein [Gammaproteobacteria bacterium]